MEHLAERGPDLPAAGARTEPGRRSAGSPGGPAAIVTFLDGHRRCGGRPPRHCGALGEALARLHRGRRATFRCSGRTRSPLDGWRPLCSQARGRAPTRVAPGLAERTAARARHPRPASGRRACRAASSMPTSSPTTCSSSATTLSGLIDFYFACTDAFAYDLAICLNAWCFEADGSFNVTKGAGDDRRLSRRVRPPRRGRGRRRCRCSAAARRCASC